MEASSEIQRLVTIRLTVSLRKMVIVGEANRDNLPKTSVAKATPLKEFTSLLNASFPV